MFGPAARFCACGFDRRVYIPGTERDFHWIFGRAGDGHKDRGSIPEPVVELYGPRAFGQVKCFQVEVDLVKCCLRIIQCFLQLDLDNGKIWQGH